MNAARPGEMKRSASRTLIVKAAMIEARTIEALGMIVDLARHGPAGTATVARRVARDGS